MGSAILFIGFILFLCVVACKGAKKAQANEDDHKAADRNRRGW